MYFYQIYRVILSSFRGIPIGIPRKSRKYYPIHPQKIHCIPSKSDINHCFKNCIPDMSRINRSNIDEILNLDTTKDNNIVSDSLVTSSENSKSVVRFNNQTTTLGYVGGNSSENSHGYTLFWRFNFIWLICFVICMCFIATFLLLTHYYQDFLKDKFSRTIKFSSETKKADQF